MQIKNSVKATPRDNKLKNSSKFIGQTPVLLTCFFCQEVKRFKISTTIRKKNNDLHGRQRFLFQNDVSTEDWTKPCTFDMSFSQEIKRFKISTTIQNKNNDLHAKRKFLFENKVTTEDREKKKNPKLPQFINNH